MNKYRVTVWEKVWTDYAYIVSASNPDEAIAKVKAGEYEDCEGGGEIQSLDDDGGEVVDWKTARVEGV